MKTRQQAHNNDLTTEEARRMGEHLRAAYPQLPLSDTLRHRVALAAEQNEHGRGSKRLWRGRLRFGLALGGALAAVLLAIFVWPRRAAAISLRRIQSAILDTRSAHIVTWDIGPGASRVKSNELWYQQGKWRIERAEGKMVTVCADGVVSDYNGILDRVLITHADRPSGYDTMSGFSLTASRGDAIKSGQHMRMERQGETRDSLEYLVTSDVYPLSRARLWVDTKTDLPLRSEVERKDNGQWVKKTTCEFRFNEPLAADLFAANFPHTAHVVDVEAGRPYWRKRLEIGLQRQKVGGTEVVLRDAQVNSEGDVFVLFTRGTPLGNVNQAEVELEDDQGTRYLTPSQELPSYPLIPTVTENGFIFDGAVLEGAYLMPLKPRQPWTARRFTLSFAVHAGQDQANFTFHIEKPEVAYTPEYMPYMERGLGGDGSDYAVRYQAVITRAAYYQHDDQGGARALELYNQALALDAEFERETASKRANEEIMFAKYETLTEMGRREEARATLKEAYAKDIYSKSSREKIEAALRKEHLK